MKTFYNKKQRMKIASFLFEAEKKHGHLVEINDHETMEKISFLLSDQTCNNAACLISASEEGDIKKIINGHYFWPNEQIAIFKIAEDIFENHMND